MRRETIVLGRDGMRIIRSRPWLLSMCYEARLLSGRLIRVFTNYSRVIRMSSDDGSLFGLGRGSLTAIGAVLFVIGIILFLVAATTMMAPSSNPFDFAANQAKMSSSFGTAVIGMIL